MQRLTEQRNKLCVTAFNYVKFALKWIDEIFSTHIFVHVFNYCHCFSETYIEFHSNLLSVHIFVHDLENKLFLLNQDAEYKLFSFIIRKIILVLFWYHCKTIKFIEREMQTFFNSAYQYFIFRKQLILVIKKSVFNYRLIGKIFFKVFA